MRIPPRATKLIPIRLYLVEGEVLAISQEEPKLLDALEQEASGHLAIEAVVEVRRSGMIPPGLAPKPLPSPGSLAPLTPREREILELIGKGLANPEAARILKIAPATVRTHLEHIYRKLDVTNRIEAVTDGIRRGLLEV